MEGWAGILGAFAITLGALAIVIHLMRRMQRGVSPGGGGLPLRVLQRVSIGPRQGVALVQVGERVLVLSMAENAMHLLAELAPEERSQVLRSNDEGGGRPGGSRGDRPTFRIPGLPKIGIFGAMLAMCLMAGGALAQAPPAATTPAAPATPAVATTVAPENRAATLANIGVAALSTPGAGTAVGGAPVAMPGPIVVQAPQMPKVQIQLGEGADALNLTGTVGLVVFMGMLTLLPAIVLMMTSFTRILIVLHFLRSALGAQTAPPGQLLVAMAILLTGVVMNPTLQETNRLALQPYLEGRLTQVQAYEVGVQPFREFMLRNMREQDLTTFIELSGVTDAETVEDVPLVTVVSAFVTSELRTAFQMGFVIFLPFVVLDVIVGSVLMSLGMFMLPPVMVSLPFKLLLFVLADGWTLVVQNLVRSFH